MSHLARRSMKKKQPQLQLALQGRLTRNQRWILSQLLDQYDAIEAATREVEEKIREEVEGSPDPFVKEAARLLDTIPGVAETVAEIIISEIGVDMRRSPMPSTLRVGRGRVRAIMSQRASARAARRRREASIYGRR
jgi:transposase